MRTLVKTKLHPKETHTFVQLRDFEIEYPIQNKQSVTVVHCLEEDKDERRFCTHDKEEKMILTWRQLKQGRIVNTMTSMFPDSKHPTYLMIEYRWNPERTQEAIDVERINPMLGMAKFRDRPEFEKLRKRLHS